MDVFSAFSAATAHYREVPDDWVSPTGLRPLLLDDPCLLWLRLHGAQHGFEEDPRVFSFLDFIGNKGHEFEAKWVAEVAPCAMQGIAEDWQVRENHSLWRTLAHLDAAAPVLWKAALWWAPERIYGTADVIAHTTWLYERQGYMPKRAYLITRDRPFDPLVVQVRHQLDQPLDREIAALCDRWREIKVSGDAWLPWRDAQVAPNWGNKKDEPWHEAKKRIAREHIAGGPLEWLPRVGKQQAEALAAQGYGCLEDLLAVDPAAVLFEDLPNIGATTAARIRAVLTAQRTKKPSAIPAEHVPPRAHVELFVDFEYFTNVNVDFDTQWPEMHGCEMVFMIGVGWEDEGMWRYKQFVVPAENHEGEHDMFTRFLTFLDGQGVFDPERTSTLYHWTSAEEWQSARAAERHGLGRLRSLPWYDLQQVFHSVPVGIPGAWGYGLKEIATALGRCSPEHQVAWPEGLGAGLTAMVMGWEAYRNPDPLASYEMGLLSDYLEVDCKALCRVLDWLRTSSCAPIGARSRTLGWYTRYVQGARRHALSSVLSTR